MKKHWHSTELQNNQFQKFRRTDKCIFYIIYIIIPVKVKIADLKVDFRRSAIFLQE